MANPQGGHYSLPATATENTPQGVSHLNTHTHTLTETLKFYRFSTIRGNKWTGVWAVQVKTPSHLLDHPTVLKTTPPLFF